MSATPYATPKMLTALNTGRISKERFDQQVALRRAAMSGDSKGWTTVPVRSRKSRQPRPLRTRRPNSSRSDRPSVVNLKADNLSSTEGRLASSYAASSVPAAAGMPGCDYYDVLIDPKGAKPARIPDSFDRATAVFRSINEYSASLNTTTGDGRFAMCAQPILGDISNPTHYQLAMVDTSQVLDFGNADWTSAASYSSGKSQGSDPRIDINGPFLTSPAAGHWAQNYTNPPDAINYNNLILPPTALSASATNIGLKPTFVNYPGPNPSTSVVLPPGNYSVTLQVKMTPVTTAPPSGGVRLNMITTASAATNWTPPLAQCATLVEVFNPTTTVTLGTPANVSATFSVSVGPTTNKLTFVVVDATNQSFVYTSAGVTASNVNISNAYFAGALPYSGSGPIEEMRPVAMSLMVSYFGPSLTDGGIIAGAFVPNDLVASNYFLNNSNAPGQLQFHESVMKMDRSYNGRLSEGCRVIWMPFDPTDTAFRSVTDTNANSWPAIVIAGAYQPGTTLAGNASYTLRVELCVVYEFITKLTAFDLETRLGTSSTCDLVWNLIKSEKLARSNSSHWAWIKAMASKAAKFYRDNRQVINPLMMTIGSTLL